MLNVYIRLDYDKYVCAMKKYCFFNAIFSRRQTCLMWVPSYGNHYSVEVTDAMLMKYVVYGHYMLTLLKIEPILLYN